MPNQDLVPSSRRGFIRSTGLAGLTIGLAGCSGQGDGGQETETTTTTTTESDEADDSGDNNQGQSDTQLTAETPGSGSLGYAILQGMARILDESGGGPQLSVGTNASAERALRLMGRGDISMTHVPGLYGVMAYQELNPFEGADFSGERALDIKPVQAIPTAQINFWWGAVDDAYQTVDDLRGESVSVASVGAQSVYFTFLYAAAGDSTDLIDAIEPVNMEYSQVPSGLQEGRIAAGPNYVLSNGVTPGWAEEMLGFDNIHAVDYTEEMVQGLEDSALVRPVTVDTDEVYQRDISDGETTAVGLDYGAWVREDLPEDDVYNFTKTVLDNYEQLQEFHAALSELTPESVVEGLNPSVPVHPGAARYFKEEDLWSDDLTTGE